MRNVKCISIVLLIVVILLSIIVITTSILLTRRSGLQISIIHLNDFHARFEETSTSSNACEADTACIGGFSRVFAAVNDLYYNGGPNPIFLNAGDNFQGTLWYTLFKWNVTQHFLNMLPTDAITLGNHEFDDGMVGVVPFLETIKAKVVISNIDDTLEPTMQGLYEKGIMIERDGKQIGIVGVILSTTNELSSTGNLVFLDESDSVNVEAQRLLDNGAFTVIVLSHCGYDVDQEIARKAIPGISVIVGAHSHTLLYTGSPPSGEYAYGEYPTAVQSNNNETVLVVQASAYTKYLGNLSVEYDEDGNIIHWEGNPIYLDENIPQDTYINELLEPYRLQVEEFGNRVLGTSKVLLEDSNCMSSECNFGNFIADAMVAYYSRFSTEDSWTRAAIGIINSGSIRSSIPKGEISFNDLATAQPFGNTFDYGELLGQHIKDFMETAASPFNSQRVSADINLLQVSGIRAVIDVSRPLGDRITSLKIRCHLCDVPKYEDVDFLKYYPIVVPTYLHMGGDGFTTISKNLIKHAVGPADMDVLTEYIAQQSPLISGVDERIIVVGNEVKVVYHG